VWLLLRIQRTGRVMGMTAQHVTKRKCLTLRNKAHYVFFPPDVETVFAFFAKYVVSYLS